MLYTPLTLTLNNQVITLRKAQPVDIPQATKVIHSAFEVWKTYGLTLAPMLQTESVTAKHLLCGGYVAETAEKKIVGTFSITDATISITAENEVLFDQISETVSCLRELHTDPPVIKSKYLVFKKAAVIPEYAGSGLGKHFIDLVEDHARTHNYDGVALQTARDTPWLFAWYSRLGYKPIAKLRYPGSQVETVLLIKNCPTA